MISGGIEVKTGESNTKWGGLHPTAHYVSAASYSNASPGIKSNSLFYFYFRLLSGYMHSKF